MIKLLKNKLTTPPPYNENLNIKYKSNHHHELISGHQKFRKKLLIQTLEIFRFAQHDKAAFTLAEVLITLVIIGIIAAITVPSLIAKYNEQQAVARLKKAYSVLNNITNSLFVEYGNPSKEWGEQTRWYKGNDAIDLQTEIADYYIKHMNIICDDRTAGGKPIYFATSLKCSHINSDVKKLNGTVGFTSSIIPNTYPLDRDGFPVTTADGIMYHFYFGYWEVYQSNSYWKLTYNPNFKGCYMWIYVDINGKKKPNQLGRDIFVFALTNLGILPLGHILESGEYFDCNDKSQNGFGCAGRVLNEQKINY